METELRNILGFWASDTIDETNGGFIGEMDHSGLVKNDAEKGAVLNARLLWTFSSAFSFFKEDKYLQLAQRAYDYLTQYFWDKANGGLFWSLNPDGTVINSRKQAYAQGFGIYGFSEYYKASGNKESLDHAIQLFRLMEKHFYEPVFGGYIEALTADWQVMADMRLSEKDANEPKSMNTHLHIIEPYTNLYRLWPANDLKESVQRLIKVFRDKIIDAETAHFKLFFDLDWTTKSDIVSYGHDIEGAWLLNEAAHFINDEELIGQMKAISIRMVDVTINEGLDKDGSVFYEY
ncbi:MAG: AGE family epimerase/isomerase, partial [Bacteroidales bacterium]|nr:AGE family epimerase/isomerase [Bacteroidales bacterium]